MSSLTTRLGLQKLAPTDPWAIEQFSDNWDKIDSGCVVWFGNDDNDEVSEADGAGGIRKINNAIEFSDGTTWLPLVRKKIISVRSFGARGDGVTDDTFAIQAAFNAASGREEILTGSPGDLGAVTTNVVNTYDANALVGAEVWFPPGVYSINDTIAIDAPGAKIYVDGEMAWIAPWMQVADRDMVIVRSKELEWRNVHVGRVATANPLASTLADALNLYGTSWFAPRSVWSFNSTTSALASGCVSATWEDTKVLNVGATTCWHLADGLVTTTRKTRIVRCEGVASQAVVRVQNSYNVSIEDLVATSTAAGGFAVYLYGNVKVSARNIHASRAEGLSADVTAIGMYECYKSTASFEDVTVNEGGTLLYSTSCYPDSFVSVRGVKTYGLTVMAATKYWVKAVNGGGSIDLEDVVLGEDAKTIWTDTFSGQIIVDRVSSTFDIDDLHVSVNESASFSMKVTNYTKATLLGVVSERQSLTVP